MHYFQEEPVINAELASVKERSKQAVQAERDSALEKLTAVEAERDSALEKLTAVEAERSAWEAGKAQLEVGSHMRLGTLPPTASIHFQCASSC